MRRTNSWRYAILALFFLSGISGLVYQIVWTRMLVLVFGNTLMATSTVLSAFMGGLAAGSFVFGKYVDRRPRPLVKVYALLEAGIGLFALLFPVFLALVQPLYAALYRGLEGNISLLNLVRFGVCFALISIPTFFMGATLPVLLKRFVGERAIGYQVGFLYGLNTAGAVAGALACGYVLLGRLGMRDTTLVAVGINLGVAVVAWLMARGERIEKPRKRETSPAEAQVGVGAHGEAVRTMVLIGIGISGFCALAYEVFWARMLNLFLSNNVYSFTAILATFLTGIALGSLIYSRFLSGIRNQIALFILLQVGIGLISYVTPFLFSALHGALFSKVNEALTLAKTSVVMLAPTVLMGIAVPLAVQIWQRGAQREGTSVGTVYAVNTIGAILGAFVAGFVLIPYTGLHTGVNIVAGLNVIAGFLPLFVIARNLGRAVWSLAFAGALAVMFLAAPAHLFRGLFERSHPSAEILHYKEGKIANVVVYDFHKRGFKDLYLNAVEEASSRLWHVQLFKLLGILPTLVHDEPDDALMIAFGAGMSAGACIDQVNDFSCVDLNPDIDEVAQEFRRENLDVINNPKLNRIVNDGRNALLLDPHRYSLIISDATNPKMFDSWTLYTEEFYELVKERLEPDGVFCQWVLIPLPGDAINTILNTFRTVFPHTSFWCVYGSTQCLMLGTPERLEIDLQQLQARLNPILESSGLAEFGIDSAEKFLSYFLLGEDGLGRLLDGFELTSTDDLPRAQFHVEQDTAGRDAAIDLLRHQESVLPYLTNLGPAPEQLVKKLDAYRVISRRLHLGFLHDDRRRYEEAQLLAVKAGIPDDKNIASRLEYGPEKKRYYLERIARFPGEANAHNNLGYIYWKEKDHARAIEEFQTAVTLESDFATARANLARIFIELGRLDEAAEMLMQVRELNPAHSVLSMVADNLRIIRLLRRIGYEGDHPQLYMALGEAYFENGEIFESIDAVVKAAELQPDEPSIYLNLVNLYERVDFVDEAAEVYRKLAELRPHDEQSRTRAAQLSGLHGDVAATQRFLNGKLPGFPEKREDDGHPESCAAALAAWDDFEFDGKIERDKLKLAAALFEESIEAKSDDTHAYRDAAVLYEILGDYSKAASLWRQSPNPSPDDRSNEYRARRLALLAQVSRDAAPGGDEARALSEIGMLYRVDGDIERALEFTERALDKDPSQVIVWVGLAEILLEAGSYEKALQAARRATELKPDHAAAERIIEQLEQVGVRHAAS